MSYDPKKDPGVKTFKILFTIFAFPVIVLVYLGGFVWGRLFRPRSLLNRRFTTYGEPTFPRENGRLMHIDPSTGGDRTGLVYGEFVPNDPNRKIEYRVPEVWETPRFPHRDHANDPPEDMDRLAEDIGGL